ncbi:MAG TPA: hypothetical protein VKV03_08310 [Candidatus Binataceae bacterium]|nr:hypothetical protein [Candidatus Binataceae bacterium]
MNLLKLSFAGAGAILTIGLAGCGMVQSHVDCDQVAQQQRSGEDDAAIAKATGVSLADVQSCSQTGSSGGRETANNYQDQPNLPVVPMISGGSIR